MPEQNDIVDGIQDVLEPPKPKKRGKNKYDADMNDKLAAAVDAEMSDSYNYSSAELYTQMAEAWHRYYRHPYGNEEDGFSQWVSPMITKHVNQAKAFITGQYFRNAAPIIKFRPDSMEDVESAELADEYVNYVFRSKLDGHKIVDDLVMNAALLKIAAVRVSMKETRQLDEIEFKYSGPMGEPFENALAHWMAANAKFEEIEPDYEKEEFDEEAGTVDVCYRWTTPEVVERYPSVDVISPGAFFVSRQAESGEDARAVMQMSRMTISDLKIMYPEAPAMNGYKKKDYDMFWEELVSDYLEWYTEIEWLAKWSHDSLGFVSQYTEGNDESAGLGAKQIFVQDAEILFDGDDTGKAQLCHVVKVGNNILHKQYITERSFIWGSLLPTANRWLGLSFVDLLGQEAIEETNNMRVFTDATVDAGHSNPIVDPDQIELDDVENRTQGSVIRRKRNANAKAGVTAIEWTKQPPPDPSILTMVQAMQASATTMTGVGANFQGATTDEVSDMRVSTETAKIIDNNSSLMLNYFARNFGNLLCKILVKILNVAVMHSATPQILQVKSRWEELAPMSMKPRSDFILNADIGVNDAQEKTIQATAIMQMLTSASGGGGQDAQGNPIPQIPVQLSPVAGYEAAKKMLAANGVLETDLYLINPEVAQDQVQQQGVQQMIQQMVQQGIQQGVQQAMQAAMQQPEAMKMQAEAEKLKAETGKISMEASKVEADVEEKVWNIANKVDAEDRREEADVEKAAAQRDTADTNDWKAREEIRLKEKELDILREVQLKAEENKVTAVVSP